MLTSTNETSALRRCLLPEFGLFYILVIIYGSSNIAFLQILNTGGPIHYDICTCRVGISKMVSQNENIKSAFYFHYLSSLPFKLGMN